MRTLELGKSKDFKAFTNLVLETSTEVVDLKEDEVGNILLSEAVSIVEAPEGGWNMVSADKFCGKSLRSSTAGSNCAHVPDIDISSVVASCRGDLMHSGDSRVASLHKHRMMQECKDSVFRNSSMWTKDEVGQKFDLPKRRMVDALCVNNCSGNGVCERGFCECAANFVGADCSQTTKEATGQDYLSPPVITLANRGLCDVRANPCRDVVVLADGLVDHDSLMCSFEIYKVRYYSPVVWKIAFSINWPI